ncbi:EamA family transporter [Kineobactrum sediminis]|uniref:EamA family transporter n=1 Tax=Kineobactrum sediminis TaxID=1905677 RepID=A0A2N5Y793_9GAMM|nr:DMT family transporter [Kineobactrum sediminis]PLW84262.1 EamA family transporter [Kineobactrum sediminis]
MKDDRKALMLGLAAVLLWSTAATAFKLALREMDVFQLVAWSVSASAFALLLIVGWQGKLHLLFASLRAQPLYFLAMAAINPLLYYLVLLHAYDLLPAQQAQTINYTWAITLALLAVPLLGQSLGRRDLLAAALGYTGVVIIATEGQPLAMAFTSLPGVALALGSTLIWALYWILNTRNQRDPLASLCLNFILATPAAWLLCALFSAVEIASWQGLSAALYVGLFEMGITFALWSSALRLASSVARVGNLIFLSPLFSLVFISTILGEAIHPATLVGLALIIPGVLLQQAGSPPRSAPDAVS